MWDKKAQLLALQRAYYSRPGWKDGTDTFRDLIEARLSATSVVLDLGAGAGTGRNCFLQEARTVVGVDIDETIVRNRLVNYGVRGDVSMLPFKADSFDLVFADFVLEHLDRPMATFKEVVRVLRPSGYFAFRTPNVWHYSAAVSKFTPHAVHVGIANWARGFPAGHNNDVFPTRYRLNSRAAVRKACLAAGFRIESLLMVEREPSYMMFHPVAFNLGYLYERMVNASPVFSGLRSNLFVVCHLPPA